MGKKEKDFLKSKEILNQIKEDSAWTNEDSVKTKKKIFTNKILDDEKFEDKEHSKNSFADDEFQKDREDMEFRTNRELTSKNVKFLRSLRKVNSELKNIIQNKEQHCKLCKVMNKTQFRFKDDCQFQQETETVIVNNEPIVINLVPQYLIDMGKITLCHECEKDTGYDKLIKDTPIQEIEIRRNMGDGDITINQQYLDGL